jgi:MYXO-CTERM domain-containing protein
VNNFDLKHASKKHASKKRASLKLAALLVVIGGLFVTTHASAYVYINSSQCPNGASWSSSDQPLEYYLNEDGSNDVSFSQLKPLIQTSFDAWGEPCCSTFNTNFQGTTAQTALSTRGDVVLSWEEDSWPTQMGNVNQTIGVTLSSVYNSCEIANAPILFNGVGFQFCTSGSGCTDLQSIATHEIGHNLGLGHSRQSNATMYYAYQGGSGTRSLSQDDISGVCSLYQTSCSCSNDDDCGPTQICNGNQCEEAPCESDNDCPGGQECNTGTGDCEVPSCGSDTDCADGYVCDSQGKCGSACPVCSPCSSRDDCGANGFCTQVGGQNKCVTTCGQNGSCPGDSKCFRSGEYYVCLNPDADTAGVCPSSYTCTGTDSGGGGGACDGLGDTCGENGAGCTPDNDVCLTMQNNDTICSCTCNTDSDCGDGGLCTQVSDSNKACVPGTSPTDPCDGVTCDAGKVCSDGQCVDDGSSGGDDAGGSSGDAGARADTGLDDGGNSGEPEVNVTKPSTSKSADSTCSATGPGHAVPSGLMLLGVFGLGVLWRRKRSTD